MGNRLVFITEVQSVYSAVRAESLYITDTFRPYGVEYKQWGIKLKY